MNMQIRRCPPLLSEAFAHVLATEPYAEQTDSPMSTGPSKAKLFCMVSLILLVGILLEWP